MRSNKKTSFIKILLISLILCLSCDSFAMPSESLLQQTIMGQLNTQDKESITDAIDLKETQDNELTDDEDSELDEDEQKDEQKDEDQELPELSVIESMFGFNDVDQNTFVQDYFFEEIPTEDMLEEEFIEPEPLYQFGYDIFNIKKQAEVDMNIPVNDDYELGAGDSIIIRLWGKIEQRVEVVIDQKGSAYIPKVGHLSLAGTTIKEAEDLIKKEFSNHYVNYELSVSIGELKTIKVFILGEVPNPGAYDVSSLSTLFTALHYSGGVSKRGTLRNIQLKRSNKTIATVDLYSYLLKGDNSNDPQLKNYDTIFVPPIGSVVSVAGGVKRPGIYELKYDTSLFSVINYFGGGIWGNSNDSNIKLERISDSNKHVILDINTQVADKVSILKKTTVKPNDKVFIDSMLTIQNKIVQISGEVYRPGKFQFAKGMTLAQLLKKAQHSKPGADLNNIKIYRFVSKEQKTILFYDAQKDNLDEVVLQEWDHVEIDKEQLVYVSIDGAVQNPGYYQLFKHMKLLDIIKLAIEKNNISSTVEVVRKNDKIIQEVFAIDLEKIKNNPADKDNMLLQENDIVYVKQEKNYSETKYIEIEGEVRYPGNFAIKENESIQDILNRAGGITTDAFLVGAILNRADVQSIEKGGYETLIEKERKRLIFDQQDMLAQTNYVEILEFIETQQEKSEGRVVFKNKEQFLNNKVQHEDKIFIPKLPTTVSVIGGIHVPRGIVFKENEDPSYYINFAGGYTQYAKKNNFYVFKANGAILKNYKHIEKGDVIYVPEYPKNTNLFSTIEAVNKTLSIIVNTLSSIYLIQSL
mgnify:CR=1 FL=1